jgi:ferredoxin
MAKTVRLEPIGEETSIQTNGNILSVLLKNELNVLHECGGRGMCATCHVYIKSGMEGLSPASRRERRTIEVITSANNNSRLACQALVIGEGVVVELPSGTYVSAIDDIESLIGTRAEQNILHPLDGRILVEAGKLVTRSMITQLQDTRTEVSEYLNHASDT